MKNSTILISVGALNLVHGLFHLLQFIQSMLLVANSTHHHEEDWLDSLLHNPILAVVWAIIGLATLIVGIRDYKHHKNCK